MKTVCNYISLFLAAFIFTNCGSSLFMLDPDEEFSFEMGRKVIEKEDEKAYSRISFEELDQDSFIFLIFVYNKEQGEFLFDPANIYSKYYDENKNLIRSGEYYAFDPEMQISELDKSIEERKNVHEAVTGLNIVFSLFDTIVDLNDDDENNTAEVLENVVIFTENQIAEEIDYDNDIDYLKAYSNHWKNDVLRKTELSPDEGIEGIIYMPVNPEAKYVKIYLTIGSTTHIYKFKQIQID